MRHAICIFCGAVKTGVYIVCEKCQKQPESDNETILSLALTDLCCTDDELEKYGLAIASGQGIDWHQELSSEIAKCIEAIEQSKPKPIDRNDIDIYSYHSFSDRFAHATGPFAMERDPSSLCFLGFDRDGFDRDGFDEYGFDCNGIDRYGFDREGYDQNGFDREGRMRCSDFDKEGYNTYGYNSAGFNRERINFYTGTKFDYAGTAFDGRSREELEPPIDINYFYGRSCDKETEEFRSLELGDINDFDEEGYNALGFDRSLRNRITRGYYDLQGYDFYGYDPHGYDRSGMNKEGYYHKGYDLFGFLRDGTHILTGTELNENGESRVECVLQEMKYYETEPESKWCSKELEGVPHVTSFWDDFLEPEEPFIWKDYEDDYIESED